MLNRTEKDWTDLKILIDAGDYIFYDHADDDAVGIRTINLKQSSIIYYYSEITITSTGAPEYSGSDQEDYDDNYAANAGRGDVVRNVISSSTGNQSADIITESDTNRALAVHIYGDLWENHVLDRHGDVDITNVQDGDRLEYSTSTGSWVNTSEGGISNHNSLTGLQGGTSGEYFHLTNTEHTDLTDSGDSSLHYHSSDRDRSNHTGTQTRSTISDFDHADTHIKDGSDEVDGDQLDIDYTPSNYVPTSTGVAPDLDHLGAHLNGINQKFVDIDNVYTDTKEPTGFINRTDSNISFSNSSPDRTFTIAPAVTSFDYYIKGTKYTVSSSDTVQIPDTEGLHYIYYNGSTLSSTTTFTNTIISDYAYVANVYWDATNNLYRYLGDERHGIIMDGDTHSYLHNLRGTQWKSGLALGNMTVDDTGDDNTHAQFSVSNGEVRDEDIVITITDDSPQDLSTVANIPIFYRLGSSGDWRVKTADTFPIIYDGTAGYNPTGGNDRVPYNEWTGSTWQLTEIGNDNDFVLVHYFATNDVDNPVIGIQGQNEYTNLSSARTGATTEIGNLITTGLPIVEFVPIATVIFQTNDDGYTNTPHARIRSTDTGDDYIDWRTSELSPSSGSVTDHINLSGLEFDNSGHSGFQRETYVATSDPTANNDSVDTASIGITFRYGDLWLNTSTGELFVCEDAAATTAVWSETRDHNNSLGLQGGTTDEYFHLTNTEHTDLTDSGDSSLHYHSSDRNRANHTGTQTKSTISDFAHAVDHIKDGSDEIDGDKLDIDFTPSNYTPTSTGVAPDVDHLAAHLNGIDQAIIGASTDINVKVSSNDTTTGFLEDKIVVANGSNTTNPLESSTLNEGGDEDLQIQFDESKVDHDNLNNTHNLTTDITHNNISGLQGGSAGEYFHFTSTGYTDLTDGGDSTLHYHASDRARANHTGTQTKSTISDFAHAGDHITSGSDEIDGDKLDIDWDPTNYNPSTAPSEADNIDNLTAHLYGIDQAIGTKTSTGHTHVEDDITDLDHYDTSDFTTDFAAEDLANLGTRAHSSLTGIGANDHHSQQHAIDGSDHTGTLNHNNLSNLQGGSAGEYFHFTSTGYTDLTDGGDSTLHYHASDRNRANHTGTQTKSTISDFAHAGDHITGGSDEVDGDKLDIDWNPTNYTPSTTPTEADNVDNLTAHLYGIDQALAGTADEKVKVSSNDTTAGYFEDKFVVAHGSNTTNPLELSTLNDGADEDRQLQFDESKVDHDNLLNTHNLTTDITHNNVNGLQGGTAGEYYHLTATQHTDLTDSGDSSLHYHSSDRNRANHTGTQTKSTISDFDHAADHITGGSDEIDGDKLDIDWNPTNYTPSTSPSEADNVDNLTAHLYGIDQALGSGGTDEKVGVSSNDSTPGYFEDKFVVSHGTNTTNPLELSTLNDGADEDRQLQFDESKVDHDNLLNTHNLTTDITHNNVGGLQGGTSGQYYHLTSAQHTDLTDSGDSTIHYHASDRNRSNHTGTQTKSTISDFAHAVDHITGGSDEIDGDKLDIDWSPTNYTPSTTPTEADNVDNLTAHLYGIDQALGAGSSVSDIIFDAYDSVGGTEISGGWTDVPLDTERQKSSEFTHTGSSAEVTVTSTGTFIVMYRVTTQMASGTARSASQSRLMIDTGGGYAEVSGSYGRMYNRETNEGGTSATAVFIIDITSGDKLKVQAQRSSGNNNIQLFADGSALTIFAVKGPKGEQGPSGPADAHASTHITGQSDEIDGDKLDIDWNPTNYTPSTTPTEADSVDNLTAHLYGIDQALTGTADEKVKVSSNDTTAGYFEDKFVVAHGTNSTNPLELSTLNDGADEDRQLQFDVSKVDHDSLNNFVANEHINHSSVSISTTEGIQGGGNITTTRNLKLDISGLSTATATDEDNDYFVFYETSTGTHKKIIGSALPGSGGGGGSSYASKEIVYFADMMETPDNSDWTVNALAGLAADSNNNGLSVRLFDDTTEEGIGFTVYIPENTVDLIFHFVSRAETGPGSSKGVKPKLYVREIVDNAAVESWSSGTLMTTIDIPSDEDWQYDTETISLSTLNLVAGRMAQFELTRVGTDAADTLSGDWTLYSVKIEPSPAASATYREYVFYADSLENPVNSDWTVNALAPALEDSNNAAFVSRRFDDTTEEGVGLTVELPDGATNIVFDMISRAETGPGSSKGVKPKLYVRELPDNSAPESWSAGTLMTTIDIPSDEDWQYDTETFSLSSLSLVATRFAQFEITRVGTDAADTLSGDWTLFAIRVSFT